MWFHAAVRTVPISLVTRVKGEVDTRQRIVCLTDAGKAMEELKALIPSLDKLIEGLR